MADWKTDVYWDRIAQKPYWVVREILEYVFPIGGDQGKPQHVAGEHVDKMPGPTEISEMSEVEFADYFDWRLPRETLRDRLIRDLDAGILKQAKLSTPPADEPGEDPAWWAAFKPAVIDKWLKNTWPEDSRYRLLPELQQRISPEAGRADQEVTAHERDSLLKMILGMAIARYEYDPSSNQNSATGEKEGSIVADLQRHGFSLTRHTVKRYLDEAKDRFSKSN